MASRYRARIVIEGDTKEVKKALRELEQQTVDTGVSLKQQFGRAMRGMEADATSWSARLRNLFSPKGLLGSLVGGMGFGAGFLGIGALFNSIGNAFTSTKVTFASFEKAMAEVSTLVDTTRVSMESLSDQVLSTSKELGKPPLEQAKAYYQIFSAGITDTADALEVLRVSTKAGIAGVTDTETAVDGITSVLNAFGLEARDATRVADAMFKTVERGKLFFRDLSQYMGQAAPTFAAVELPFEEMLAAAASLTASGMRPATAFEGLRSLLSNVIKPSDLAEKTAHALGVPFDVEALQSKGLGRFLRELHVAAKGNTEVLSNLFGDITGLQVALALSGKQANRFEQDIEAIANATGASSIAFEKQEKTLARLQERQQALKDASKINIGELAAPLVKGFIERTNEVVAGLSPQDFPGADKMGKEFATAFGAGAKTQLQAEVDNLPLALADGAKRNEGDMKTAGKAWASPWFQGASEILGGLGSALFGAETGLSDVERRGRKVQEAIDADIERMRRSRGGSGGGATASPSPADILRGAGGSVSPPPLSKSPADILRDALTPGLGGPVMAPVAPAASPPPDLTPAEQEEWERNRSQPPGGGGATHGGGGLIRFMAHGGRVGKGGWAVIGEEGPELALFPGPAHVFPNDLEQMAFKRGMGGSPISAVFHITVGGVGSPGEARAIGNEIGSGILERLERLVNL